MKGTIKKTILAILTIAALIAISGCDLFLDPGPEGIWKLIKVTDNAGKVLVEYPYQYTTHIDDDMIDDKVQV